MSGSVNKVILVSNVGADPEIRRTQAGKPIANLRVATSENWRDSDGNRKEKTEWHTVVCFNEGLCKVIENYVKKGSKLYLEGSLVTRKWSDKDGNDRFSTEIHLQGFNSTLVMLDGPSGDRESKPDRSGGDYGAASGGASRPARTNDYAPATTYDDDQDIPF